jgi:hypothetical protein
MPFGATLDTAWYWATLILNLSPGGNDNVELPDRDPLYLIDVSGDASISGLDGDDIRQVIWLMNRTAFTVTVLHQSAASLEENRFYLPAGAEM